ncbi:C39 family peptidase [Agathobaculum sp.]|uniref:C39 family peptidase n=1 Tax=Agathobaculum sp. TaxID=2048138 RepID=UPI0027B90726|nr:C39 family peptidase [Agathobaculum sp.]
MTTRYINMQGENIQQAAATAPVQTAPKPAGKTEPRRRRKVKKRRHPFRTLLLLAVLAAAAWYGWGLLDGMRVEADWAARGITVQEGTASAIAGLARQDSRAQAILDNPEAYPADYLDMLGRNSETLDFVLGYPEHHSDAPAGSLTESLDTVPLLLQWDMRWGYQTYGSSTIAVSGCAPVCLSMAASYLTGDASITPYRVAQYAANAGYYVPGQGTSWSLLTEGAFAFGISCRQLSLDEAQINAALDAGHPVICSMSPGDFTTEGHFIVLYGRTADGYLVRDPNSIARSEKMWTYDRLSGQIAALWECTAM